MSETDVAAALALLELERVRAFWSAPPPETAAGVAGTRPRQRKDPLAQYLACVGYPAALVYPALVYPFGQFPGRPLPWWAWRFMGWCRGFAIPRVVTVGECLAQLAVCADLEPQNPIERAAWDAAEEESLPDDLEDAPPPPWLLDALQASTPEPARCESDPTRSGGDAAEETRRALQRRQLAQALQRSAQVAARRPLSDRAPSQLLQDLEGLQIAVREATQENIRASRGLLGKPERDLGELLARYDSHHSEVFWRLAELRRLYNAPELAGTDSHPAARVEKLQEAADRQAMLLALAVLSLLRPGWIVYLQELSAKLDPSAGPLMFEDFRRMNRDQYRPADFAFQQEAEAAAADRSRAGAPGPAEAPAEGPLEADPPELAGAESEPTTPGEEG
jgi:hypothetical protein